MLGSTISDHSVAEIGNSPQFSITLHGILANAEQLPRLIGSRCLTTLSFKEILLLIMSNLASNTQAMA
jgi:hypothetical protein